MNHVHPKTAIAVFTAGLMLAACGGGGAAVPSSAAPAAPSAAASPKAPVASAPASAASAKPSAVASAKPSSAASAKPSAAAATKLEDTIVVAGSAGALGDAFKKAIAKFAEPNGIKLNWVEGLATEELGKIAATKNNPQFDLYQAELVSHYQGASQGLWQPLDPAKVPNLASFPDKGKLADRTAIMPDVDAVAIAYNKDKYASAGLQPPKDFPDLLTGDKLKGHVVFPHIDNGYMRSYIAVRAKQINAPLEDPKPVFQELQKASGMVLEYPRTPAQMADLFANGQAWVGVNGVSRIKELQESKLPVEMVAPPETPITPVSWSYVAGAPHPNAAQALMNWLLSPEGQVAVASSTHYSPVDPNVKLPPDVAKSLLTPDELKRVTPWDYATVQKSLQTWRDDWASIVGAK